MAKSETKTKIVLQELFRGHPAEKRLMSGILSPLFLGAKY